VSTELELSATRIEQSLTTRWLGRPCHFLPQTTSTNEGLAALAQDGAPAGTMVLAEFQSAGRGRHGRRWQAPPGTSLLLSLLFRPPWSAAQAAWLMMIASIATTNAVRQISGAEAALKWPNDLLLRDGGTWHKAGGFLLETSLAGEKIDYVIAGIGVNVNVASEQLPETETPATSLLVAAGRRFDRLTLLVTLLQEMETRYDSAAGGQSPHAAWDALLVTRNQPVTVRGSGIDIRGTAMGTDRWGRLLVEDGEGKVHAVAAGDVSLQEKGP
jgi:BirA family transcriptional regulator, biotin operon repressor / biotin---[acetyl-CoA-carboxylase] ligase